MDSRKTNAIWGERRAQAIGEQTRRFQADVRLLRLRKERVEKPIDELKSDPIALTESVALLREQHDELEAASDELRAQLEELSSLHERVQTEREWASEIFDDCIDSMIVVSAVGVVQRFNHSFANLVGVDTERLKNKPLSVLVHRDDSAAYRTIASRVECDGKAEGVLRMAPRNGRASPMRVIAAKKKNSEHQIWRFYPEAAPAQTPTDIRTDTLDAVAIDLAARLQEKDKLIALQERALLALRRDVSMKEQFIAVLAHEMRSPLNAVLGWSQLLASDALPESKRAQALSAITRAAESQAALIEDVFDVARIDGGKFELDNKPIDLVLTLKRAIDAHVPAAADRGIVITSKLLDGALVFGDETRLLQVFSNILSNAVKFNAREGSVDVVLSQIDGSFVVKVCDTGRGMTPELLPRVFDCFIQEEPIAVRAGMGLGMYIARQIVERHGGEITAKSDGLGHGSTFTVRLPEYLSLADAIVAAPSGVRLPSIADVNVLLVDARGETSSWMQAQLDAANVRVDVVGSLEAAWVEIDRDCPDVMVASIEDPVAAAAFIRKLRARAIDLPAIAVTSTAQGDVAAALVDAGFDAHLVKPVSASELLRAIATASELKK